MTDSKDDNFGSKSEPSALSGKSNVVAGDDKRLPLLDSKFEEANVASTRKATLSESTDSNKNQESSKNLIDESSSLDKALEAVSANSNNKSLLDKTLEKYNAIKKKEEKIVITTDTATSKNVTGNDTKESTITNKIAATKMKRVSINTNSVVPKVDKTMVGLDGRLLILEASVKRERNAKVEAEQKLQRYMEIERKRRLAKRKELDEIKSLRKISAERRKEIEELKALIAVNEVLMKDKDKFSNNTAPDKLQLTITDLENSLEAEREKKSQWLKKYKEERLKRESLEEEVNSSDSILRNTNISPKSGSSAALENDIIINEGIEILNELRSEREIRSQLCWDLKQSDDNIGSVLEQLEGLMIALRTENKKSDKFKKRIHILEVELNDTVQNSLISKQKSQAGNRVILQLQRQVEVLQDQLRISEERYSERAEEEMRDYNTITDQSSSALAYYSDKPYRDSTKKMNDMHSYTSKLQPVLNHNYSNHNNSHTSNTRSKRGVSYTRRKKIKRTHSNSTKKYKQRLPRI